MSPETQQAITNALKADVGNAYDNLYRARASFRGADLSAQHGESGRTRGEVLREYEAAHAKADRILAEWMARR